MSDDVKMALIFVNDGFTDEEIDAIISLLNEHVEFGCCGGCL